MIKYYVQFSREQSHNRWGRLYKSSRPPPGLIQPDDDLEINDLLRIYGDRPDVLK
jgi:hypothetical protein